MKKLTIIATAALLCPFAAAECRADYKDMANQVETVADFWLGGYLNESSSSATAGIAEEHSLPEAAGRVGSQKAAEYYSPRSSGSGGVLFKRAPLPSRIHVELDYYNDSDWFGDLRYSYKDYFQSRLVARRLYHNLDNLTVFDFNPLVSNFTPPATYNSNGNDVVREDALLDDYGLKVDIDQVRLRFKTPNFPLHVYAEGEAVHRKGLQQLRFLGGSASSNGRKPGAPSTAPDYASGRVRVTEPREIDQNSNEFALGTNAHLGPVELDLSHKVRKFENNVAAPTYDYEVTSGGTVNSVHHVIPELKATTNTVRIHTSHTGRIFASATYSKIDKSNEYSSAESSNSMAYGELSWLPVAYLSLNTKIRHQQNDASAPSSVTAYNLDGALTNYTVQPGVASKTDSGSIAIRYSLVPKTNLNFIYTKKIKKVEEESAVAWSRPPKQTYDVFEYGLTNWVIPKVRITGKLISTLVRTEFGEESINNEPSRTNQGILGLTWSVTPKLSTFMNASAAREDTQNNRGEVAGADSAKSLREQYLASLSYRINDKVAITPTYTYMSYKQDRDFAYEGGAGTVDSAYSNKQKAQNFAVALMLMPTTRLNINTIVDYTITKGNYVPTSPIQIGSVVFNAEEMALFSQSHSEEINVRLDSEYDLGRGWGLGLDLRYADWKDTSVDNPSDGTFFGGLFKVSKKLFY